MSLNGINLMAVTNPLGAIPGPSPCHPLGLGASCDELCVANGINWVYHLLLQNEITKLSIKVLANSGLLATDYCLLPPCS